MIYPESLENKIGFDGVRNMIASHCSNELGEIKCREMAFSSDFNSIKKLLSQTNEFLTILNNHDNFPNGNIHNLQEEIGRIKVSGAYLTESELYRLKQTLSSAIDIHSFFTAERRLKYPELWEIGQSFSLFPDIVAIIDKTIDQHGEVKDNASPILLELRQSLMHATSSMNGAMQRIMSKYKQDGILDKDTTPSIRDGRLVIPVPPMNKRKIRGIVHDESATGKTIFIEPEEIVETNNRIREIEAEIKREIIRILIYVTDQIRPKADDLLYFYSRIGIFDFIRAKAIFAQETDSSMPCISDTQEIEWYNARHPMLQVSLSRSGKTVVPLNIKLDKATHILLISGPNAGGKSVCLKTVGIIQYMLQCGILPPVYSNSHFGIFKNLFIDIGDEQSIENELSTYSSHLANMKYFMLNGNDKSLVLIDEFGGGTEPQIGGAIAQAILKKLNEAGVFGVITTHYQNLKKFANETQGIANGAMLYDRNLMKPLFQLSVGNPGSSFAIEIAKKIGIPADVLDYAADIAGSDYINMDKYLLDIARDRRYWENKRQDIRLERKKLEKIIEQYENNLQNLIIERKEILKEAKTEAKEILSKSNASIENAIHEIKKAQAEKEQTKLIRKQIEELKSRLSEESDDTATAQKINDLASKIKNRKKKPEHKEEKKTEKVFKTGDNVTIDGSSSVGEILEINGNNATVLIGNFKSIVKLSKLKHTIKKATSVAVQTTTAISEETRSRQLNFKQEIDVRGMRTDEALQAVSYFIDDAIQFGIRQVRILHGTGFGILRQRIREYLNAIKGVKSFRDEHVQFGGSGITVVELE